jgi:hypothetical protein
MKKKTTREKMSVCFHLREAAGWGAMRSEEKR